ncbi:MAG: aldo/keto reductase [Ruminococcaceae bacterium]|nr:aldo/keto reductase [Oscillospiraceae bacterium]
MYKNPDPSIYGMPWRAESFNGMPWRKLGKSGLSASVVGLGTWKFGFPETGDGARVNEEAADAIFNRAHELGVTFWDTANRYNASSGNAERVIGRWFARNPRLRRDVVLATKLCGLMDGRTPNHCGLSRQNIIDAVHASLNRLDTDHIDLLYFHQPDPTTDPEESLLAVEDLIREGCVRYFGVSNHAASHLARLDTICRTSASLRTRVCAVQNGFNLIDGEVPEYPALVGTLPYCAEQGISYIAWSPLAEGLLTGRYNDLSKIGKGDRLFDQNEPRYTEPAIHEKLVAMGAVADELGVSMTRLTLAYMLTLPAMTHVIPAASSVRQLEDNAAAAALVLSDELRSRISAIFGI